MKLQEARWHLCVPSWMMPVARALPAMTVLLKSDCHIGSRPSCRATGWLVKLQDALVPCAHYRNISYFGLTGSCALDSKWWGGAAIQGAVGVNATHAPPRPPSSEYQRL